MEGTSAREICEVSSTTVDINSKTTTVRVEKSDSRYFEPDWQQMHRVPPLEEFLC